MAIIAKKIHGVVRTDKMYGTDNRTGVVSVRFQPGETATEIDNGCIVKLDGLEAGEREVFKGVNPTTTTPLNEVVLIATPEVRYHADEAALEDFYNEAGAIARGYTLHSGSEFSVTKECLDNTESVKVGNLVELQATPKMKVVASETSQTIVGKIIAIETVGSRTYYVVHVA